MSNKSTSTVADRIWQLRDMAGLSASDVDDLVGLARNHTQQIESETIKGVRTDTATRIAAVFGVDIAWLLTGAGRRPSKESVDKAVAAARRARKKTGTDG